MTFTWTEQPVGTGSETAAAPLTVYVVATRKSLLDSAVTAARKFSKDLNARIVLLAAQVVPYPLDLTRPHVTPGFAVKRLGASDGELKGIDDVRVLLCRDAEQAVLTALATPSVVVVGVRKRLLRTREEALAQRLRKAGHQVIVAQA